MAFRLLGVRLLGGMSKKVSVPYSEHWRQVCTANLAHYGRFKDQYGISSYFCISGFAALMFAGGIQNAVAETETNDGMNRSREASMSEGSLYNADFAEVMTNEHARRWREYTNKGHALFSEGKSNEAETYFLLALEEAKQGFGLIHPQVASSYSNLAELYRMERKFEKAEPLYLEAIELLEVTLGPEDLRVGFALHNLGGFYVMQHKLEQAQNCYERALKIKRRILGLNHPDYANTMFQLGQVLRLQGNLGDAEILTRDSIRILEQGGLGHSQIIIKRMGHLAQILLDMNQLQEAENLQRKILHILEVSKGLDSLDTSTAAEKLALTIQSLGSLDEAQELLQRSINVKQKLLPENHIQIGESMLKLARVAMLKASRNKKVNAIEAELELEKAKELLSGAIRIADLATELLISATSDDETIHKRPTKEEKDAQVALLTLMQSLDALGTLEISMLELHQEAQEKSKDIAKAEEAVRKCISAVKKPGIPERIVKLEPIRREYLSCLQHLVGLLSRTSVEKNKQIKEELRQLNKEIAQIEADLGIKRPKRFFW
ncbi:hypothetical protein SUGI_0811780 [Cryptomeria japonica]|uniref:uncharacterized protein LOC131050633 isoform X2 n=1 Tax=Cryptomeria japonica TaxID=3369 RepID=UPI0024147A36|nr:uncharacterized protein LOC131050633 isoform X2 [Cryptomeria japonica]GLJ39708.1 hypothetical protein SUGI_0811780 [Cryptomeria japonica]